MYTIPHSPLQVDGEKMPIEGFHKLRRVPGFKYEYTDGRADISIQELAVGVLAAPVDMIAERTDRFSRPEGVQLSGASTVSTKRLEQVWVDTFVCEPDYYGWSVEDIRNHANEILERLYVKPRPTLHPASVVATWRTDLVGALLITDAKAKPVISCLYVARDWQRNGVAGAMLRRSVRLLQDENEPGSTPVLCSNCLVANAASAAWHESVGFLELPSLILTNHRYKCIRHNFKHGLIRDVYGAKRRVQVLKTKRAVMRNRREQDPDAYAPSRWLEVDGGRIDTVLRYHIQRE